MTRFDIADALQHGLLSMPRALQAGAVLVALATCFLPGHSAAAPQSASELATQAMRECDQGQTAADREDRQAHFARGEELATQAVALDDKSAAAHFAVVCNLGESLRLDGEKITSVFGLRRLLAEVDRTLELDPNHLNAMATKGNLLLRLPRVFGGDPVEGERLLREVVKRDDKALTSRIVLAKACEQRGDREEAVVLASRALEVARQQGKDDKAAEAQATLVELGASTR
jgi:GTP cyclohydrolase III